tara:strand:+ start:22 stop:189 length:168 start_codon:yes stop_codon:yes gene_type:complete
MAKELKTKKSYWSLPLKKKVTEYAEKFSNELKKDREPTTTPFKKDKDETKNTPFN